MKIDEAKPGIGGTLIYFATEEINKTLSRVEPAGGKIIRPKLDTGGLGFIALLEDTEGNMIGYVQTNKKNSRLPGKKETAATNTNLTAMPVSSPALLHEDFWQQSSHQDR